jgi:hypothetical protein
VILAGLQVVSFLNLSYWEREKERKGEVGEEGSRDRRGAEVKI